MTPIETVALCRYAKACCPQQAIDEYTPDAWHDLLGDLDLEACKRAVCAVAKRQPFVAPSEIREEVRRVREDRIKAVEIPAPDPALADDPELYKQQLSNILRRLGNAKRPFQAIAPVKKGPTAEFKAARTQEDRDRVLSQIIPCPTEWCPALAGEPCRTGPQEPPMTKWHASRLMAARAQSAPVEGEAS